MEFREDIGLFLLTRFNARLPWLNTPAPDERWLTHRCDLFERFCLPSVEAQDYRDFRWFVYFDAATPEAFLSRIDGYRRRCSQFQPHFVTSLDGEKVAAHIREATGVFARNVVTVRLDNDDAISRRYLARIVSTIREREPVRRFINVRYGYVWCDGRVFLKDDRSNPFFALVEPVDRVTSGLAYDHTRIAEFGAVQQIEDGREYLQIIHDRNVSNRKPRLAWQIPSRALLPHFPLKALDVPDYPLERVFSNGLFAAAAIRRALRNRLVGLGRKTVEGGGTR